MVDKAMDCENRESKGTRSWSPVLYQTLQYFFKMTHCVGDSYIVADSIFPQWTNTIPFGLTQFTGRRVLLNMCGHHELPFAIHDREGISRGIDALPKYSVVVLNSLSQWDPLSDGLRLAKFHRLWRSTTSLVTLHVGSLRKGELRLSK